MRDVQARLAHMDALGIDVQVLYPTVFLRPALRTRDAELALIKSYNRWLAAINAHAPERMRWVAMPPVLSLDKARDELMFCKDHGACGIFMRGLEWDRNVADPYFYPLYELASELDLAVCYHSGNNSITHHDFFTEDTTFTKFKLAVVGAFHSLIEKNVSGKVSRRALGVRRDQRSMGAVRLPRLAISPVAARPADARQPPQGEPNVCRM